MITLENVVRLVESQNNYEAVRFEPALFQQKPEWVVSQTSKTASYNHCSQDTALMINCSSWGMYQLLGANIYSLGWNGNIFSWLNNSQLFTFTKFIQNKKFQPNENVSSWGDERFQEFATFYNGPGNVASYVQAMKAQL